MIEWIVIQSDYIFCRSLKKNMIRRYKPSYCLFFLMIKSMYFVIFVSKLVFVCLY